MTHNGSERRSYEQYMSDVVDEVYKLVGSLRNVEIWPPNVVEHVNLSSFFLFFITKIKYKNKKINCYKDLLMGKVSRKSKPKINDK